MNFIVHKSTKDAITGSSSMMHYQSLQTNQQRYTATPMPYKQMKCHRPILKLKVLFSCPEWTIKTRVKTLKKTMLEWKMFKFTFFIHTIFVSNFILNYYSIPSQKISLQIKLHPFSDASFKGAFQLFQD